MTRNEKNKSPLLLMVVNDAGFFRFHRWPLALAARDAGWRVEIVSAPDDVLNRISAKGVWLHPVPFRRKGTHPFAMQEGHRGICRGRPALSRRRGSLSSPWWATLLASSR